MGVEIVAQWREPSLNSDSSISLPAHDECTGERAQVRILPVQFLFYGLGAQRFVVDSTTLSYFTTIDPFSGTGGLFRGLSKSLRTLMDAKLCVTSRKPGLCSILRSNHSVKSCKELLVIKSRTSNKKRY